jgi:alkylation response protein AidB-like acyl-CoA dehydrogenase
VSVIRLRGREERPQRSTAELRAAVRAFAAVEVAPLAAAIDEIERVPRELVVRIARLGWLGAALSEEWGGAGWDSHEQGILHEELGRGSASVEGVVNVHNMASQSVQRWGSRGLKQKWLPRFASGTSLAAFALTEPEAGSDVASVATAAVRDGDAWVLDGTKHWITCGQTADVFLVLARSVEGPTAFLVERDAPGLRMEPIGGLLGCRGYALASLKLERCRVPGEQLVGRPGFGLSHVASVGLDAGRYSLAWACVGMIEACLAATLSYISQRRQFGVLLAEHALIQRIVARMSVAARAARGLCLAAAESRSRRSPGAALDAMVAKYFAANAFWRAASDAVQVHGAAGCSRALPVERWLRDAKIMEIIEGTREIHELAIARHAIRGNGS